LIISVVTVWFSFSNL